MSEKITWVSCCWVLFNVYMSGCLSYFSHCSRLALSQSGSTVELIHTLKKKALHLTSTTTTNRSMDTYAEDPLYSKWKCEEKNRVFFVCPGNFSIKKTLLKPKWNECTTSSMCDVWHTKKLNKKLNHSQILFSYSYLLAEAWIVKLKKSQANSTNTKLEHSRTC